MAVVNTVLITEQTGVIAHWVEDIQIGALTVGLFPESVCGRVFAPAAMCTPDGAPCAQCREVLRDQKESRLPTSSVRAGMALALAPLSSRWRRARGVGR